MFDSIYEEIGMSKYDVWYVTLKKNLKRRKSFDTIEELTKWCKVNKGKVKITSGSWQAFEIMRTK